MIFFRNKYHRDHVTLSSGAINIINEAFIFDGRKESEKQRKKIDFLRFFVFL